MPKEPVRRWPEATAFVLMVEEMTGKTTTQLLDDLAGQPGMTASKAHQLWKWRRGENRPSFVNAMALLYAAGILEPPTAATLAAAEVRLGRRKAEPLRDLPSPGQSRHTNP